MLLRVCIISFIALTISCTDTPDKKPLKKLEKMSAPGEWSAIERNYPDFKVPGAAYSKALSGARMMHVSSANYPWTLEGPTNTGGRFNCITKHPVNNNILYAGSASGGIFKTTNAGVLWTPVFDDQQWMAISCITLQPGNPDVIYAGTGDKNISGFPFIGNGIYKSNDAGITWSQSGLGNTGIISEIVVHPANNNIIYASAMGNPFTKNNDRGVYKSVDGGNTWTQSLFVNDSTGAIDIIMNYLNPDILYAVTWNRIRNNQYSLVSGPDAGIYKSTDGGATWNKLLNGLPSGDMSRIGITMSGTDPDKLWAVYVDSNLDILDIYKTSDGGQSWQPAGNPGAGIMGGFGWYFGRIEVNPVNDDEIWLCAVNLYKTTDGGNSWNSVGSFFDIHPDNHDLIYKGPGNWIVATDGGLYETIDGGNSWIDIDEIPNNQFYRITYNPHQTGIYAGGVQDNGTNTGNASMLNNWQRIYGADGFQIRYHPTDPDIIYAEWQNGGIVASTDGGFTFTDITTTIDPADRRNWDMPYVMSNNNPSSLYTGTYRIYKNSFAPMDSWISISGDLTDGIIYGDRFHTISAIDVSVVNNDHLAAGTSDGNVWTSPDDGLNWNNITSGLPDRYVTSVHFSPNMVNTIYVTHSGYKDNDFIPHIHVSDNNGLTWTDISSNLPQLAVNDLYIMQGSDSILFAATDGGVFGTTDRGNSWSRTGNNLPYVAVYDLDFEPTERKLLAGTFARSMWSIPVDSLTSGISVPDVLTAIVYPNPSSEFINIKCLHGQNNMIVNIYNTSGEHQSVPLSNAEDRTRCDIRKLIPGVYFLKIIQGNSSVTKKIIVN